MQKVLVLGGGFGGVQAAIALQKSKEFEVTLVSDRSYLYLYPISIWIPVYKKTFEEAKVSLSAIQKKYPFKVILDKVVNIRALDHLVECENNTLNYDYLVVAFGADKLKPKGLDHTVSICGKPEYAVELRDRIDSLLQKGGGKIAMGFGGNPKDKSAVRGGPAFEMMFNLIHYLKKKGVRDLFELSFFAPMEEPGARMGKKAVQAVNKMFDQQKVQKRYGKKITEFSEAGVVFEDGSILESDLTMFIPGATGSSILTNSDLPLSEAGFVKVNDFNQVVEFPNVFAVGDASAYEGPDWIGRLGHIAEIMGKNAAHNILQLKQGGSNFKGYQKHLSILCLMDMGNGAAFVYRDSKKQFMIPMPIYGHWLKQAWGHYARLTKLGKIPSLPGM